MFPGQMKQNLDGLSEEQRKGKQREAGGVRTGNSEKGKWVKKPCLQLAWLKKSLESSWMGVTDGI